MVDIKIPILTTNPVFNQMIGEEDRQPVSPTLYDQLLKVASNYSQSSKTDENSPEDFSVHMVYTWLNYCKEHIDPHEKDNQNIVRVFSGIANVSVELGYHAALIEPTHDIRLVCCLVRYVDPESNKMIVEHRYFIPHATNQDLTIELYTLGQSYQDNLDGFIDAIRTRYGVRMC